MKRQTWFRLLLFGLIEISRDTDFPPRVSHPLPVFYYTCSFGSFSLYFPPSHPIVWMLFLCNGRLSLCKISVAFSFWNLSVCYGAIKGTRKVAPLWTNASLATPFPYSDCIEIFHHYAILLRLYCTRCMNFIKKNWSLYFIFCFNLSI